MESRKMVAFSHKKMVTSILIWSKQLLMIIDLKKNLLKFALQNESLKAHYKAGNIFWMFWQPGIKGCLKSSGFKPRALRFPA